MVRSTQVEYPHYSFISSRNEICASNSTGVWTVCRNGHLKLFSREAAKVYIFSSPGGWVRLKESEKQEDEGKEGDAVW